MRWFDVSDLLVVVGFVCLLVGLWWLSPAAAMIVGGLGLIMVGLVSASRQAQAREQQ